MTAQWCWTAHNGTQHFYTKWQSDSCALASSAFVCKCNAHKGGNTLFSLRVSSQTSTHINRPVLKASAFLTRRRLGVSICVSSCVASSTNASFNLWSIPPPTTPNHHSHLIPRAPFVLLLFSLSFFFFTSIALSTYSVLQRPVWGVWVLWMPSEPWHQSLPLSLQ